MHLSLSNVDCELLSGFCTPISQPPTHIKCYRALWMAMLPSIVSDVLFRLAGQPCRRAGFGCSSRAASVIPSFRCEHFVVVGYDPTSGIDLAFTRTSGNCVTNCSVATLSPQLSSDVAPIYSNFCASVARSGNSVPRSLQRFGKIHFAD